METVEKEVRYTQGDVVLNGGDEKEEPRTVEGYALLFGVPSDGLNFVETIDAGALEGVIERSDVFALINHNPEKGVLARSKKGKGSLTLSVDQRGLKYSFILPDSPIGKELGENLSRGEIDSSSFGFSVEKDNWEYLDNGKAKRTIQKIKELYDVSPVYQAAYSKTTVSLRGKEDLDKQIQEEKEARQKNEAKKLDEYYTNIETQLSKF